MGLGPLVEEIKDMHRILGLNALTGIDGFGTEVDKLYPEE